MEPPKPQVLTWFFLVIPSYVRKRSSPQSQICPVLTFKHPFQIVLSIVTISFLSFSVRSGNISSALNSPWRHSFPIATSFTQQLGLTLFSWLNNPLATCLPHSSVSFAIHLSDKS